MKAKLNQVRTFLQKDLWLLQPQRGIRELLVRVLRAAVLIVEGFMRSDVVLLAGALTFKVIFAVVPLLAVMLALFKGFGGMEKVGGEIKNFLLQYLTTRLHDQIVTQIDGFIQNVNATAIGVAGFLVLIYTALSLMGTMEHAFNRIWGIKKPRTLLRRFTVYWTILTVGPILISLSLTMSAFVQSRSLYVWLTEHVPFFGKFMLTFAPFVFGWLLFTALYIFMPNTRVEVVPAFIGAIAAGTTWELMKTLYVWYNTHVVTTHQIYGSLGALPVFLLWVYLSWIIVLFGAEVAFAAQHVKTYQREIEGGRISQIVRERVALLVCIKVAKPFTTGARPPTAEAMAAELNVAVRIVNEVVFQLTATGILREVATNGRDAGLVPGRDPANITVSDILQALRGFGDPCELPDGQQAQAVARLIEEAGSAARERLSRVTLKQLVD